MFRHAWWTETRLRDEQYTDKQADEEEDKLVKRKTLNVRMHSSDGVVFVRVCVCVCVRQPTARQTHNLTTMQEV